LPEAGASGLIGKLALGTVQWGMSYGIAGRGQPSSAEVGAILAAGRRAGISLLDTAHGYGTSEAVIGAHAAATAPMRVVTKTRAVRRARITAADLEAVEIALEDSLKRLQRPSVAAVLVHDAGDLLCPGADGLWRLLERFRGDGKTERIGVSVYNPLQCRAITAAFPVQIVQLPFNLYDQRFLESGVLAGLKSGGVEVHARSAFLQGLLLMAPEALPPHFDSIRDHHRRFHDWARTHEVSPLTAALDFCLCQPAIDHVVVGCENVGQIEEILRAATAKAPLMSGPSFALADVNIIEPSRWPK
jgi:aryl-alcohol dehydrogenase-like predicted oxidoreductase